MELMINTLLLSFILFMVTPTSHSICVARHHNSTAPSSHPHPHDPPPLSQLQARRPRPSPPPPPQRNIPTDSETTSFHSTVGTTQLDDLGDTLFTRSTRTVDPRLKRICDDTDYPSLCLSSLSPSLASSGKTLSFSTALSFAIKAATQHARLAVAALARLAKAPGADEDAGEGLGVCKDSYSDALDNLQAAVDALLSKDVPTANSMLSAVVTDSENCGDALEGTEAGAAMTKYNDKLRMLASNCLAIASFAN